MIMIPILARLSDPVDPSPVFPGGYLPFSFSNFPAESIEISVVRLQYPAWGSLGCCDSSLHYRNGASGASAGTDRHHLAASSVLVIEWLPSATVSETARVILNSPPLPPLSILGLVLQQRLLRFKIAVSAQKINQTNFDHALVSCLSTGRPFPHPCCKICTTVLFGLAL